VSGWPDERFLALSVARLPVVQAPMAGAGGVALAVAAIKGGAVGSLPCAMRTPAEVMVEAAGIPPGAGGGAVRLPFDAAACAAVEEVRPELVSFHFGLPNEDLLERVRRTGAKIVGNATTVAEARALAERGVDAIIAQGWEAGGHAGRFLDDPPDEQMGLLALLPQVVDAVDVPIIAAGGIVDGPSMAAAFALGAEGVQMGTRMVSALESPVHDNWKQAIVDAAETDTVFLNRHSKPGLRALRTERTSRLEREEAVSMAEFGTVRELYFGGDLEASIALSGQDVGRIEAVRPVAEILADTMAGFESTIAELSKRYGA
jgi:NAD(P)H-dependent flavin oxidoreductase YrpB (nitropropane dioxygenase family)